MRSWPALALLLAAGPALASGNPSHDYLLTIAEPEQARILGNIVQCYGVKPFYMGGISDTSDIASWSLKCMDGRSYVIHLQPHGGGKALPCKTYESIGGKCFEKLDY